MIQGVVRGRADRAGMDDLQKEAKDEAAQLIQGTIRGREARDDAAGQQAELDAAAQVVQGAARGRAARDEANQEFEGQEAAASAIQGALTAREIRNGVQSELEYQDNAAAAIQSGFRGKKDREDAAALAVARKEELAKMSPDEIAEARKRRFPADVAEWRAGVERNMKRYSKAHNAKMNASLPVLPQGTEGAPEPYDISAEEAVDLCRVTFEELIEISPKHDESGAPVLGLEDTVSVILPLCEMAGQDYGMRSITELSQHLYRDTSLCFERGGYGIAEDDPYLGGDGKVYITFTGLMLMLTKAPWEALLPAHSRKRIPVVLMGDKRAECCGQPPLADQYGFELEMEDNMEDGMEEENLEETQEL